MKGFVVNVWLQTWSRLYGKELVEKVKTSFGLAADHVYSPLDEVPDDLPVNMSKQIAQVKGLNLDELWYKTGRENLYTFHEHYPEFFKKSNFLSFMAAMDAVHRVLTRRMRGARPPRVFFKLTGDRTAIVRYQSKRNFKKYFLGLMESASEFFKDPIQYKVVSDGTVDGQNYLEVEVKATKPYGVFEKLSALTLLGLGFLKSFFSIYSFLLPAYVFVLSVLVFMFFPGNVFVKSAIVSGGTLFLSMLGMFDLRKGKKALNSNLKRIAELDMDNPLVIKGAEELSDISQSMMGSIDKIKEVLMGISGDVQEIGSYSEKIVNAVNAIKEQLDTMGELSNEIATTAVQISNDTERISNAVTSNVDTITSIMNEQTQIVKSLNEAVSLIVNSAQNVENSADGIVKMSQRFSQLVEEAKKLQDQASLIMQIASTVSSIAEQTNLLALNAAIEAARSGEAGRGFAVVADEIRKLAEESRSSAAKISDFLKSITLGIDQLSKSVQSEFNEMTEQSRRLLESSERNKESSQVISTISNKLSLLIDTLNSQAKNLQDITSSIQNLLAISEESSATAEEISSSIQNFFAQLKVVFDSVNEAMRLLNVIKENFEGIKI
ncbi:heme NO-binding domain-containing protein [Pseudothermotoga sp.]